MRAHHVERCAVLGLEELHLAVADAVLAGAGAAHRERAQHQALVQPPRLLELGRLDPDRAGRAGGSCRRRRGRRAQIGNGAPALSCLVSSDALGEPRNRHADVGRPRARAGPQRQRRVERVVPRLPQPLAILEARRPLETAAAALGGERLHRLRLLGDVRARCRRGTRRTASARPGSSVFE